jgi:hypothetical protein
MARPAISGHARSLLLLQQFPRVGQQDLNLLSLGDRELPGLPEICPALADGGRLGD